MTREQLFDMMEYADDRFLQACDISVASPEKQKKKDKLLFGLWKMQYVAAAVAIILLTSITAVAAGIYIKWNKGLQHTMHVEEAQKERIEQTGVADHPVDEGGMAQPSVTDQGITVTAEQTLVDNYHAVIVFNVSGFALEEDQEPCFGGIDITVGGSEVSYSGGFYNGWTSDGYGYAINEDGVRMIDLPDAKNKYRDEEGNYTYLLYVSGGEERGALLGKELNIRFNGLGTVYKTEYEETVSGTWTLEWKTQGSSISREISVSESLGNTGAIVKEVEFSPITMRSVCEFPLTWHEEKITSDDESPRQRQVMTEAPWMSGVKLTDGTLLPFIFNGGFSGYRNEDRTQYEQCYLIDRILDVEEVEAILFLREAVSVDPDVSLTEDDFYVVPVK